MKYKISLLIVLMGYQVIAQDISPTKISIPKSRTSSFNITFNSNDIKTNIIDSVVSKFGFSLIKTDERTRYYQAPFVLQEKKLIDFTIYEYTAKSTNIYIFDNNRIFLNKGETIHVYGVTSTFFMSNKTLKNYSTFLLSAYHQEADSTYKNKNSNFSTMQFKDKKTFHRRNLISMGYGLSYLDKQNPFAHFSNFEKGFFYLFDAAHYIPILGGAFFGETSDDKIMIPIIGIASLFIWKKVISEKIIGDRFIKIHNEINNSQYKIPNSLIY